MRATDYLKQSVQSEWKVSVDYVDQASGYANGLAIKLGTNQ